MFCFKEYCKNGCKNCEDVKLLDNLELKFKEFTSEEEIKMSQEILCLVSSWGEPPYFVVAERKWNGICNAFDGMLLHAEILKWTYLPSVSFKI